MDLDLTVAAAGSWPFDPIVAFLSSPPHRLLHPASPSWIFPELLDLSHPPPPPLIDKECMSRALRNFKDSTSQHVLVQIWAPVRTTDRNVLSTSGQHFIVDPQSGWLLQTGWCLPRTFLSWEAMKTLGAGAQNSVGGGGLVCYHRGWNENGRRSYKMRGIHQMLSFS